MTGRDSLKRFLLEKKSSTVPTSLSKNKDYLIPRRPLNIPAVLSFGQERLWLIEQMYPGSNAYTILGIIQLRGKLHVKALNWSLDELVKRHEVLRTSFSLSNDQPEQHIASFIPSPCPIVDLTALSEIGREQEIQYLKQEEARLPFDLGSGPLFRSRLLHLTEEDNILILSMHHTITDAWSLNVCTHDLAMFYSAYCENRLPSLPELPIQYADFALWQRERLQLAAIEAQLAYWKTQLAEAPTVLELPSTHPRPPVQTFRGASYRFRVPAPLFKSIGTLGRREHATLFMVLFAVFNVLLARYTGREDLLIGSPIAGRINADVEMLIGFFVNTLVLRSDLSGNPTFRELLQRSREICLDAYTHQEIPFELLVQEIHPERDISRNPLVQVCFAVQNAPIQSIETAGLVFEVSEGEIGAAQFDLFLEFIEDSTGLIGRFIYSTDLFETEMIARLTAHYLQLLTGIVADPDQCIWEIPLLTEDERQQMLVEWNATQTDYPRDRCIHQLFEAQAEKTPHAIAIVYENQQLTYHELDQCSNQLAHTLCTLGIEPEMLVGVCMERSLELIIGLLGILKAGAAYVPLDPSYPRERLAYMLNDTQAALILAHEGLLDRLPEDHPKVLCLDSTRQTIAHGPGAPLAKKSVTATYLAYVMYTSGSTGQPKGVATEHRGVVRLVRNTNYINFSSNEVFLQFAPTTFDASTLEIWGPLLNGGRLVIFPTGRAGLKELGDVLKSYQITTLWLTAGLFHQMIEYQLDDLKGLRQLLAGGDVLSPSHVQQALRTLPNCRLLNGYGPTENTTFTTCYPMSSPTNIKTTVPIGRPIANTSVYVLDRHLQPVPIGVPGELYIGGDGLARGYLNRKELTQERFIPNPFSTNPAERLYKTGDVVRYLVDGNLDFVGRTDHQVKIRGFRIELGEIETVLAQHPAVRESMVIIRNDTAGNKQLVAYMTAAETVEIATLPTQIELRAYLRERLPEYMLPAACVFLHAWPLTPNGKLDREALPPPTWELAETSDKETASYTLVEATLIDIWKNILGLNVIGIHDNFFELGGHSLLATRVISQVRKVFHVELFLRMVFDMPTIAQLAEQIEILLAEQYHADTSTAQLLDPAQAEHLLAQLDNLTDEEVEKLLSGLGISSQEDEAHE